jgi:hypothetical protein
MTEVFAFIGLVVVCAVVATALGETILALANWLSQHPHS